MIKLSELTLTLTNTTMKTKLLTLIIVLFISLSASADNFTSPKASAAPVDSTTIHTYEIKSIKYPIFRSKRNSYYIWKTSSKTNKKYKYYLSKEIQQQIKSKDNK